MSAGRLFLPSAAVKILVVLAAVQAIRSVLPLEFDTYVLYFLGFDAFRRGAFEAIWLYGAATSAFVHGGWAHLGANALWLVVMSAQLRPHLYGGRYFAFFLVTAAAGALAHAILNWGQSQLLIGSSGVVFGFLGAGAHVLLRGHDGVSRPGLRDYAQYMLLMMIMNVGYALLGGGNISWEAHAGGFFAGILFYPLLRRRQSGQG